MTRMSEDFEISMEQAKLAFAALRTEEDPVTGINLLNKLKDCYSKYSQDVEGQVASQAADLIQDLERGGTKSMVDVLSRANLNSAGKFSKTEIEQLIKNSYKGITESELNAIMSLMKVTKEGDITLNDIQSFLKQYTTSKKVALIYNISLQLYWR